jgi:hypothetical protein
MHRRRRCNVREALQPRRDLFGGLGLPLKSMSRRDLRGVHAPVVVLKRRSRRRAGAGDVRRRRWPGVPRTARSDVRGRPIVWSGRGLPQRELVPRRCLRGLLVRAGSVSTVRHRIHVRPRRPVPERSMQRGDVDVYLVLGPCQERRGDGTGLRRFVPDAVSGRGGLHPVVRVYERIVRRRDLRRVQQPRQRRRGNRCRLRRRVNLPAAMPNGPNMFKARRLP